MDARQAICEKCGKAFAAAVLERKHKASIVERFMTCPNCGSETTLAVSDLMVRRNMAKMRKLDEEIRGNLEAVLEISGENAELLEQWKALRQSTWERTKRLEKEIKSEVRP